MSNYRGRGYCRPDYTFHGYEGGTTPPDYSHTTDGRNPEILAESVAALRRDAQWRPKRNGRVAAGRGPKPTSMDEILAAHGVTWTPGPPRSGSLYLRYEQAARQQRKRSS